MTYNGSGTFNRLYDWTDDRDANIKIRADRMDDEMDGMATGLSTAITKNGQTTITANLPMSTYKHTGVGDADARDQYIAVGQLQDGELNWIDGGGTADAITATYAPAVTVLVDGQHLRVRATAANATTTPTFSPNGLTARDIVKAGGTVLVAGDIVGDGHELDLVYDLTNTQWELLNPAFPGGLPILGSLLTTRGDIIYRNATVAARLAVGGGNNILKSNGTDPAWTDFSSYLDAAISSTQGVIIYRGAASWASLAVGTSGQFLQTQGAAANPQWASSIGEILSTAQATTSGTSFDFTSLPAGISTIEIFLDQVSLSGTDDLLIQIGDSGGLETTGYVSASGTTSAVSSTSGFILRVSGATRNFTGVVTLNLADASNKWTASICGIDISANIICVGGGRKSLSGELDRIRLLTNGSDTFDNGEVNIRYWN